MPADQVAAQEQDLVIAGIAEEEIVKAGHIGLLCSCYQRQRIGNQLEDVIALATKQQVAELPVEPAGQHVVAWPAKNPVFPRPADEHVIAFAAQDHVAAFDGQGQCRAGEIEGGVVLEIPAGAIRMSAGQGEVRGKVQVCVVEQGDQVVLAGGGAADLEVVGAGGQPGKIHGGQRGHVLDRRAGPDRLGEAVTRVKLEGQAVDGARGLQRQLAEGQVQFGDGRIEFECVQLEGQPACLVSH